MRSRWIGGFALALTLLAPGRAIAQPAIQVLSGEVAIKSDDHHVLIGLDEADPKGRTDGRVDYLFLYVTPEPILFPFSSQHLAANLEIRPGSLRVLVPQEQSELEFLVARVPSTPRAKGSTDTFQGFGDGLYLFQYSGAVVEKFFLSDILEKNPEMTPKGLWAFIAEKNTELLEPDNEDDGIVDPFVREPDPGSESTNSRCKPSCTASCTSGACSAACNPGFCAKCGCSGPENLTVATCYCGF